MKTSIRILGLVATTALIAACGNSGLLSSLGVKSGSNNDLAARQNEAIEGLATNWCETCPTPDGGALELSADVRPESEEFNPANAIELSLRISDPLGVVDASGALRVDRTFRLNDFDFVASLPAEAWKISADGTVMRVVLYSEEPLPEGVYHAEGSITDGEHTAADHEEYTVGDDDGGEHEGEPTPEATCTPGGDGHGDGDHPTPTPTEGGDATPTPTPHEGGDATPTPEATPTI